ncbi:hypothetical protein BSLG_004155 [Batrachochytrium salamandrivorans]|nr:hypothetical protein BSLG_004155 [Batrachochytrium salamandrivorans]
MKKSGSTKSLSSNSSTRGVKAPQLQHHLSQSTLPIPAPTADASQQQSPSSSFWASPLTMHKSIHSKTNLTNDMHPPRISGNTASHSSHPLSSSHTTPSRQSPVAIFWDIENCAPPNSVPGYVAVNNIRKALLQFGPIQQFRAYMEIKENTMKPMRSELQSSGCAIIDTPHNARKDAADKMIMVDMLSYVMDTPTPAGASPVLLAQATTVLEWRCDIFDAEVVEKIQRDREESMMRVSALARSTSQLIAAGGSFENLTAAMCGAPIGGGSYSGNDIIPVKRDVFQTFSSIDINSENRSASLANDSNGGMHMYSPHEPEFFDVLMEVLHLAKQSGS